jgi:hypothetical protein
MFFFKNKNGGKKKDSRVQKEIALIHLANEY